MKLKQHIKKLCIKKTYRTPEIEFRYGILRISGTFVPVDPAEFYIPIYEWVKKYSLAPAPETIIDIFLKYTRGYAMNYIHKLLQELILLNNEQVKVIINWHYITNGMDVKAGRFLSKKLNYPFNFVEVEEIW